MDGPRSPVGVEAATQDLAWSSSVFLVCLQYEPLVQKNPPLTRFAVTHDRGEARYAWRTGRHPPSPNLFMHFGALWCGRCSRTLTFEYPP